MERILVVDDEPAVCEHLCAVLRDQGFQTQAVQDLEKVPSSVQQFQPTVLLVDYRFPKGSGLDVLRDLRRTDAGRRLAIIMVSGFAGEDDRVAALDMGADDYVVKPIAEKELGARIRAVVRRRLDRPTEARLQAGPIDIEMASHKVWVHGQEVHLTLTEFRILAELIRAKGQVMSRDQLRSSALANMSVTDRTIDVHMASLRKKIGAPAESIHTIRGVGYRLDLQ